MARKVLIVVGKEESLEGIDTSEFVKTTIVNEFGFDLDTLLNPYLRACKITEKIKDILKYEYPVTQDYSFFLDCSIPIALDILKFLKANVPSEQCGI